MLVRLFAHDNVFLDIATFCQYLFCEIHLLWKRAKKDIICFLVLVRIKNVKVFKRSDFIIVVVFWGIFINNMVGERLLSLWLILVPLIYPEFLTQWQENILIHRLLKKLLTSQLSWCLGLSDKGVRYWSVRSITE